MAIVYPLSLPTTIPQAARIELTAQSSVGISTSPFTFSSQRQEYEGMYWGISVTLPPMVRADAEEWITFLLQLNGPTGTFLIGDKLGKTPRGTVASPGSPQVDVGGQVGQTLNTKNWDNTSTGVLLAGDYIQLQSRLYKILKDIDSDGSGLATLDIWPRLRESPADDTTLTTINCVGTFRLTSNAVSLASLSGHENTPIYSISFSGIESI